MNKWIKGLGITGSENEGNKQRQEPTRRNMPRGKNRNTAYYFNWKIEISSQSINSIRSAVP